MVVFGDEASQILLGAYTLGGFALAEDPVHRRLVPVTELPMAAMIATWPSPEMGTWA